MSKVITVSRTFINQKQIEPEKTYFVESILNSLKVDYRQTEYFEMLLRLNPGQCEEIIHDFWESLKDIPKSIQKHHTIRTGNYFKPGEKGSFRVWAGRPYYKVYDRHGNVVPSQIIFHEDVEIKSARISMSIKKDLVIMLNGKRLSNEENNQVAINDGFNNAEGLKKWFKKGEFSGQLRCWTPEKVNYI